MLRISNNWFIRVFSSSIGKKLVMAITGLFFCLFLLLHVIDNMMVYRGETAFNMYVKSLHSFPLLISVIEIVLIFFALLHVSFGLFLFYQNWKARPVRYSVKKWAGGRTISSSLMPYTGLYILVFIVVHLINFRFALEEGKTIYSMMKAAFSDPLYVAFYTFSMVVVALHIRHGFWSAFQTLGFNHPKYMPFIQRLSVILAVVIAISMGSVPVYFYF